MTDQTYSPEEVAARLRETHLKTAQAELAALRETFFYASPGSDVEFTSLLLGFDTAAAVITESAKYDTAALEWVRREERNAALRDAAAVLEPAPNAKNGLWANRVRKLQAAILAMIEDTP
jgi:hypothetical protein